MQCESFGGSFASAKQNGVIVQVLEPMSIDNFPIDVLLEDHDTKIEEVIKLAISMMKVAEG